MNVFRSMIWIAVVIIVVSETGQAGEGRARLTGHGFAPVNGTRLYYEVQGQGEALVLIHGGMLDSRMWDDQFADYAKRNRVLRYDIRGFGGSVRPADRVYSDADDLAALMDYLEIPRAHLVGLSLGGRVALDFLVANPKRAISLIIVGGGPAGYDKPDPEGEERWWANVRAARDEGTEKATELWLQDPFMSPAMENPKLAPRLRQVALENAHNWLENPLLQRSPQPVAAKRLGEIKVPALVIVGERDVPRAHEIGNFVFKEIKGAKKVAIPKAGHMVNMEQPEAFDKAVGEFLKALPRAEREP
jgi:pimeloyl-ACP methyl ester carboxylesterase